MFIPFISIDGYDSFHALEHDKIQSIQLSSICFVNIFVFYWFVQEHASANVFTGDEEIFAFQRTISRLSEMQSKDYWELWNKKMV